MKTFLRELLIAAVICSIILGVVWISQKAEVPEGTISPPTPRVAAEPIQLQSLTGERFDTVYDALNPEIPFAYLIYFHSNCGYCHLLLLAMQQVTAVPVLAVSVEPQALVATIAQELELTFTILSGLASTELPDSLQGYPCWQFVYYEAGEWVVHSTYSGTPNIDLERDGFTLAYALEVWAAELTAEVIGEDE